MIERTLRRLWRQPALSFYAWAKRPTDRELADEFWWPQHEGETWPHPPQGFEDRARLWVRRRFELEEDSLC